MAYIKTHVKNDPMWLVYQDSTGNFVYQPWDEVPISGTPIDPDTDEEMELIGWAEHT